MLSKKNSGGLEGPAKPQDREDSLWRKLHKNLVHANSSAWFESLGPVPCTELFADRIALDAEWLQTIPFLSDEQYSIVPSMLANREDLGEQQEITSTRIGRAVIELLEELQVDFYLKNTVAVNHREIVEQEGSYELEGQWRTVAGTPFVQTLRVFKDSSGEENALWSVSLVASALRVEGFNKIMKIGADGQENFFAMTDELLDAGGFDIGALSREVHIPVVLKIVAFMAETPLPSTQLFAVSRNLTYKDVPEELRPIPTLLIEDNILIKAYSPSLSQGTEFNKYTQQVLREVVTFGWRFGEGSVPHLRTLIPTIVNGCTFAVSAMEDGFVNYRLPDDNAPWDHALGSPCVHNANYVDGESRMGWAQWVPITQMGEILVQTEEILATATAFEEEGKLERAVETYNTVIADGAGVMLGSAINSLLFGHLIPDLVADPSAIMEVRHYAETAIEGKYGYETTNALCNLGLAEYICENYAAAERVLLEVLNRPNEGSLAEACVYLALVYEQNGRDDLAKEYWARSEAAGGYQPPEWVPNARSSSGSRVAPRQESAGSSRAKFCANCGGQFSDEAANFCANCGATRP
jgi:hypothetical protein